MNLFQLFRNIRPFVRPYRLLVALTLVLTLVGSAMQQVNAIVLDRTVDAIATEQIKNSIDASARSLNIEKIAKTLN